MKKVCVVIGLALLFATFAFAEQKIIHVYPQIECGGNVPFLRFLEDDCVSFCQERSSDVNGYLRSGWRVVWTGPAQIFLSPFKGGDSYCRCIGSQYVLEK